MKEIELIQAKRNSFPVRDLRIMFGIKKTDSYWILKNRNIQTVTINGKMRILKESFWNWYNNQTKYHIIDGPEPGAVLKETSYSVRDLMQLLDISNDNAYTLIGKGVFDIIKVDYQIRITKESFERWYPTQEKYRLPDDRAEDEKMMAVSYSMPEIGRILGLHRNSVYSILKKPGFEFVRVAGQKRVTISSFEKWYSSQSRYKRIDLQEHNETNAGEPVTKDSASLSIPNKEKEISAKKTS